MLLVLALLACADKPCKDLSELNIDTSVEVQQGPNRRFPDFALGVEYAATGVADAYGDQGVSWAKTRLEAFEWDRIEPDRPAGSEHTYDWTCPDAQVAEWQQAGLVNIQAYFTSRSAWGSVGDDSYAPAEQHLADYRAWVRALFERYDGDGVDDMPGLVQPVRHWVFGGEWTGFWPDGDAQAYLGALEVSRAAALSAYPDALLGTVPFLLMDVFEGNEPTEAEIEARLATTPESDRHDIASHLAILDRPDLYDYVNVHSLGDYTELGPTYAWLRARLREREAFVPIWVDDAFPTSFLANNHYRPAMYPVTDATYDAVYDVLQQVAEDPGGEGEATAWIRAEAAKGAVKKAVTAFGEGYVGIQLGNTTDWMSSTSVGQRRASVSLIGAAAMMGMVDVEHPEGMALWHELVPGERRAAWYALALAADKLDDGAWDGVTPIGGATGVRGYRMDRGGQALWVLWAEDGLLQLPGEQSAVEVYTLSVGEGDVRITTTPTTTDPVTTEVLTPSGGFLRLEVGEAPLFIERG